LLVEVVLPSDNGFKYQKDEKVIVKDTDTIQTPSKFLFVLFIKKLRYTKLTLSENVIIAVAGVWALTFCHLPF